MSRQSKFQEKYTTHHDKLQDIDKLTQQQQALAEARAAFDASYRADLDDPAYGPYFRISQRTHKLWLVWSQLQLAQPLYGSLFDAAGMFEIDEPGWADKHDEYIAESYAYMSKQKRCPHCGETDITKFGTDRSRKDGLSLLCSSCHNAYFRDYRRNHPKLKQHKPKACPQCGETDLAQFGRDASMRDGLALYCRTCSSAHNKAWYAAHKSIVSKRRKIRRKQDNNQ